MQISPSDASGLVMLLCMLRKVNTLRYYNRDMILLWWGHSDLGVSCPMVWLHHLGLKLVRVVLVLLWSDRGKQGYTRQNQLCSSQRLQSRTRLLLHTAVQRLWNSTPYTWWKLRETVPKNGYSRVKTLKRNDLWVKTVMSRVQRHVC